VRSFVTDEQGVVDLNTGISQVNHRTPIEERWGGWYVTGTHGKVTHRGNLVGREAFEGLKDHPELSSNVTNLGRFFETEAYLSPHSDIVALMVLEHQTHMHNFITRLRFEGTMALQQYGHVKYLNSPTEAFIKYLLFAEEAPIASPIQGTSSFASDFAKRGPFDKCGRSLRQFDLKTRLFKFPCSYLIYSEAFDALPDPLKQKIYGRLWEILSAKESAKEYAHLSAEAREAIIEILAETKKGLPAYWKPAS
jgi:hypothetical protein